jgi:hypothetical protein
MLNYAVEERMISPEQNPFSQKSARTIIERAGETSRERFPKPPRRAEDVSPAAMEINDHGQEEEKQ